MNDAVADRIGENWFADLFTPARNIKLRAKDRGRFLVPCLGDFKKIPCLGLCQRVEKLFVQNEKCRLLVLLDYLSVCSIKP